MSDAEATKVSALAAVYAGTRADNSSIMNVSLALMGAGIAYITATLATIDKFTSAWAVLAVLPIPLWIVAAYHSILTSITMVNAVAAQYTEGQLLKAAGVEEDKRQFMGYQRAEMITNIGHKQGRIPHKISVGITFGGTGALVLAYTGYMIFLAWKQAGWILGVVLAVFYLGLAVVVMLSWKYGKEHADASLEEVFGQSGEAATSAQAADGQDNEG